MPIYYKHIRYVKENLKTGMGPGKGIQDRDFRLGEPQIGGEAPEVSGRGVPCRKGRNDYARVLRSIVVYACARARENLSITV